MAEPEVAVQLAEPFVPVDGGQTLPLFDDTGPRVLTSADRRRTRLQRQRIDLGVHPLDGRALHPEAPADVSRKDRYLRPFTCGLCVHRAFLVLPGKGKPVPKCDTTEMSHGAASTVWAWWPACTQYEQVLPV